MSGDYNKLYYNAVTFNDVSDGVEFGPHFTCPICHSPWTPILKLTKLPGKDLDFNQQVAFQCPQCALKITLYVAVYRDNQISAIMISVVPIPSGWWVTV